MALMRFRRVILPPQSDSSRALARRIADSIPAPQAAPPAGYYHPDLIVHPVIETGLVLKKRWAHVDRRGYLAANRSSCSCGDVMK
jgi:hypothetical protein